MNGLIFDPFAGISGDMLLGALVDLGLEPEWLRETVASTGLAGVGVQVERVDRRGISCGRVRFELPHEHAHRHLRHVLEIVERTPVSPWVREKATEAFRRIAQAEAEIHGTTIERIHFHEVGALDSILDVLCGLAGLERLGYRRFWYRPVAVGQGRVDIAHGSYPVPAPATLKLLAGHRVRETGYDGECTTPTGAAMLTTLVDRRLAPRTLTVGRSGYGAGTRDPEGRPNCLRLIECEEAAEEGGLHIVQTDVDDLDPEYVPAAREALVEAGALDVVVVQVAMKKGRPGLRFEALVPDARLESVMGALYRATTTIGVRHWPVERPALPREEDVVEWRGHSVRRKLVRLPDGTMRAKVEYEDVVRVAREVGMTALEVRAGLQSIGAGNVPLRTRAVNENRDTEES